MSDVFIMSGVVVLLYCVCVRCVLLYCVCRVVIVVDVCLFYLMCVLHACSDVLCDVVLGCLFVYVLYCYC